jgi:hypothetical protein
MVSYLGCPEAPCPPLATLSCGPPRKGCFSLDELAVNASAPTAAAWIRSAVGFLGSTAFTVVMLALLHGL